ncbi:SpoIIE family protein phosphatase [Streptomyces sp. NPDC046984]|uniref:PP2C family protein-serine/threonine phosphatase n=1 Tax=Streptomyces sp. NPDC046984 TaxID=3155138 RepID=UPI0033CA7902
MMPEINFEILFDAAPSPYLVMDRNLVIGYANRAYMQVTGRARGELVGRSVFDVFPDIRAHTTIDGVSPVKASLLRVLDSGEPDPLTLQRYDILAPGSRDAYEERWWYGAHVPVPGPDGTVQWIIQHSEDVTDYVLARRHGALPSIRDEAVEAVLYNRTRELQGCNDQLRRAHAREREVAVTLQEAMLEDPDLSRHDNVTVRYIPAVQSLHVGGDWFDVVDVPPDRCSVAIGDVVGHGLQAAALMGMLRSALSGASRAVHSPAGALEVLGRYAESIEGALNTTVATALVDTRPRRIIYSVAGHPPPVLMHSDGRFELLDQATGPPLGIAPLHLPRPQVSVDYRPGDTLVMYTDGLIERRGQDIDAGLALMIEELVRCCTLGHEQTADALLDCMEATHGGDDDIALIVFRL